MATVQTSASGRYALIRDDVIFPRSVAFAARRLGPRYSFWRNAQFNTIRLCLVKIAVRATEMVTGMKIALRGSLSLPDRLRQIRR
jgi:hypothetical protein